MTDRTRTARSNDWRRKQRLNGGRAISTMLGPQAATALEQLMRERGTTVRQVLEQVLVREVERLREPP